ncbi:MAG: hypothetical protein VKP62_06455 [Candidatus Sericytochromatia bacterium]|nr:hypothetical protein [Candidatus Sericytochromatia bacterium]
MSEHLHAQDPAPSWAQLMMAELKSLRTDVAELTKVVKGGGDTPSHAEQIRDHAKRIGQLEALVKWVAGIGTGIVTAIGSAWAMLAGGPHK